MEDKTKFTNVSIVRSNVGLQSLLEFLEEEFEHKVYIAGGYARYCVSTKCNPAPVNDLDLFCENNQIFESIKETLNDFLVLKYISPNGILFENKIKRKKESPIESLELLPNIQLIIPQEKNSTVGTRDKVISGFDLSICQAAINSELTAIVSESFIKSDETNKLFILDTRDPIKTLNRIIKYCNKGYKISESEIGKLFNMWLNLDVDSRDHIFTELSEEKNIYISDKISYGDF